MSVRPESPTNVSPPPAPSGTQFRPLGTRHRRRRTHPIRSVLTLLVVLIVAAGVVLGAGLLAFHSYYQDRIVLGMTVLGEPVGGLTRAEAQARLTEHFSDPALLLAKVGGEPLVLRDGTREFRAWPWEIGWQSDWSPAVNAALAVAHTGDLTADIPEQIRVWWQGYDLSTSTVFDQEKANRYLDLLAKQIEATPRDLKLTISGLRVVETPAQSGRQLDRTETLRRVLSRLAGQVGGQIEIPTKEIPPKVTDPGAVKAQVENFLATPLILTFGDREWAIDQGALASLVELKVVGGKYTAGLNHAALVTAIQRYARDINQPARDARLHWNGGDLTPFVTSQEGRMLDAEASAKTVEARFAQSASRPAGSAAPPDNLQRVRIPLVIRIYKPAVDLANLDKMGIKEVVAVGESSFKGSIPGRIQNIKTSAAQFDGVVVPPGAVFSFAQYLGDVVEANGYEDAWVIFGDRSVFEPGGGVCQVSSTAFRAAFWGGFPIVERWAHDYRVGYYEPPAGLDATVFAPSVDFKFKNDTGAYLLMETRTDVKNLTLTFTFYGTKPNRKVTMEGPVIDKVVKAPAPLYTNDPTLNKGVVKQIDFSADGAEVTVTRIIEENGQTRRDKFVSKYKPWQAKFLVGTKQ